MLCWGKKKCSIIAERLYRKYLENHNEWQFYETLKSTWLGSWLSLHFIYASFAYCLICSFFFFFLPVNGIYIFMSHFLKNNSIILELGMRTTNHDGKWLDHFLSHLVQLYFISMCSPKLSSTNLQVSFRKGFNKKCLKSVCFFFSTLHINK